jgi:predicted AlkP superfamily phosphohydrolase/phosphomutase
MASPRTLMIGLDGATFDLIDPWVQAGELPHLAWLLERGARGRLASTCPPATFPAWTTLMTGVNPGRHGVFDFTQRRPGAYEITFVNATYRRRPSVWRVLSRAGRRVGVMGLPATYPPESLNGFLISGFDAPVATGIDRSFVNPPQLYDEICHEVGPYQDITGFQEVRIGPGWHEMALRKLLEALERRLEVASYLLTRETWDCFMVLFGESDTVAHHFWAFHDPDSPRYDASGAQQLGDAILRVYRTLDQAIGRLISLAPPDTTVAIVSDHGFGGTGAKVVYLNRWLAERGWLTFARPGVQDRLMRWGKRLGLLMPPAFQEWAFRSIARRLVDQMESRTRLGGIDWRRTVAFSEEVNTFPGIWLNVRDREPLGQVARGVDYERLRDQMIESLVEFSNPDTGEPVVRRALRREEVYRGPWVELAPDIVLEPALDQGYAYTFLSSRGQPGPSLRSLAPHERLGAKGGSMNGSHRPEGILILAGDHVTEGAQIPGASLLDIAPTLCWLLDVPAPEGTEGRVLSEAFADEFVEGKATQPFSPAIEAVENVQPYSKQETAIMHERLRGLGYRE